MNCYQQGNWCLVKKRHDLFSNQYYSIVFWFMHGQEGTHSHNFCQSWKAAMYLWHCSFMSFEVPVLHYRFTSVWTTTICHDCKVIKLLFSKSPWWICTSLEEFILYITCVISAGRFLFTLKQMKMPVHVPSTHSSCLWKGFKKRYWIRFYFLPMTSFLTSIKKLCCIRRATFFARGVGELA